MSDSIPLPPQPALLGDFPAFVLGTDVALYRVHLSHLEPQWFGQDPGHRFDPPPGDVRSGTCYVASSPDAAFVETLGRTANGLIDEADMTVRSMSVLSLSVELRLADFTAREARGRGLTGEVSAGGPSTYTRCQLWAAALFEAGFRGIRYKARHDPTLASTSYALFGGPGLDDKAFAPPSTWLIPLPWVEPICNSYGLRIVPTPPGGL